jgi:hypothetical protein
MRRLTVLFIWLVLAGRAASGLQGATRIVVPAPPEASCERSLIDCNTSLNGKIEETDCKISSGVQGDVYGLKVPPGMFVTVSMDSPDFDSYLVFREERGLEPIHELVNQPLPIAVEDDNGGGGTNSRVAIAANPPGLWIITARGKKAGSHGQYTLTVKCENPH